MKISIIIPHYEKSELTNALISQLRTHCSTHDVHVLVVDDGSPTPYEIGNVQVARIDRNSGFLLASNLGLQFTDGDVKVVINNDVEVRGDFIPMLEEKITQFPQALIGNFLQTGDTGWNRFDRIYPYLEGYFLAASAQVWEDLGGFDMRFVPNDYEDVDLSTQCYYLGYPVISLNTPMLYHLGARTYGYNSQRLAITRANKEKFAKKWVSTLINVEGR
jgi:GT2 family glycosyltransferase